MLSYYDLLGVTPDADESAIRNAYRQRIKALHPDRFVDDPAASVMAGQMTVLLNTAWATLGTAALRARYDSAHDHGAHRGTRSNGGAPDSEQRSGDARTGENRTSDNRAGDQRAGDQRAGSARRRRSTTAPPPRGRPTAGSEGPHSSARPAGAGGGGAAGGPTQGQQGPGRQSTTDDVLRRAVEHGQERVRASERVYTRSEIAALGTPVLVAARPYHPRFVAALERVGAGDEDPAGRAGIATVAAAMALAAGWRDVAEDSHLMRVEQRLVTRAIVTAAIASLEVAGAEVDADGYSWVEFVSTPAARAAGQWRPGRRGAREAPPTSPVMHLDDVDRIRFAAGRRLTRLPESEPPRASAGRHRR